MNDHTICHVIWNRIWFTSTTEELNSSSVTSDRKHRWKLFTIETSLSVVSSSNTAIVVPIFTHSLSTEAHDIEQVNAHIMMTSHERLGVETNRSLDCEFSSLLWLTTKETPMIRITGPICIYLFVFLFSIYLLLLLLFLFYFLFFFFFWGGGIRQ